VCDRLGYHNIEFYIGDGTVGWEENAPYDAIITTAAAPSVPKALIGQLAPGGRLIIPVGGVDGQRLLRAHLNHRGEQVNEWLEAVRFVPLIGEQGWQQSTDQ
jgi:protein-L-isoaspartate(D-aspartate) O-methyltransferase